MLEPTSAGLLSAKRLRTIRELIPGAKVGLAINKVRDGAFAARAAAELQLPIWVEVPYDPELAQVEREGLAPIDAAPASRAVAQVTKLLDRLREEQGA